MTSREPFPEPGKVLQKWRNRRKIRNFLSEGKGRSNCSWVRMEERRRREGGRTLKKLTKRILKSIEAEGI